MNVKKILILAALFLTVCGGYFAYADIYHYSDRIDIEGSDVLVQGSTWTDSQNAGEYNLINLTTIQYLLSQGVSSSEMSLYLTGNKNTIDYSGNDNTITPTDISYTSGVFGSAYDLNGVSSYLNIGDSAYIPRWSKDFSISTWFYTKSTTGVIFDRGTTSVGATTLIYLTAPNKLSVSAYGTLDTNTNTNIQLNTWTKCDVTWNATSHNLSVYINGDYDTSNTNSTALSTTLNNAKIGRRASSVSDFFNGYMDEFIIYNRTLSAREIKEHYLKHDELTPLEAFYVKGEGIVDGNMTFNGTGIYSNGEQISSKHSVTLCKGNDADEDITKQGLCDFVCKSTSSDCTPQLLSTFQKINNTPSPIVVIESGEYPIGNSLGAGYTFYVNVSELTIYGYGVTLKAMNSGLNTLSIRPLDVTLEKIKYNIFGLDIDMNNLADWGLVLFNPENSIIQDVRIRNRQGAVYSMFDLWCELPTTAVAPYLFCKNNVVNNLILLNSTSTNWEAGTISYNDNMQMNGLTCENVAFKCMIDYLSIRSKYSNIQDISDDDQNESTDVLVVVTTDVEIRDVVAPKSNILIYYDETPYTDNYLKISDARIKTISTSTNTGFCIHGVGEAGFWCDSGSRYSAHPDIFLDNVQLYNSTSAINIGAYCYNSSFDFSYPNILEIKNSYLNTGTASSVDAKELIIENNVFDNAAWNTGGYINAVSFTSQNAFLNKNTVYGSTPSHGVFLINENNSKSCHTGVLNSSPQNVYNTTEEESIIIKDNVVNAETVLYRYHYNGVMYATNQTANTLIYEENNAITQYSSFTEYSDVRLWTYYPTCNTYISGKSINYNESTVLQKCTCLDSDWYCSNLTKAV